MAEMQRTLNVLIAWLPLAVAITVLAGLAYVLVQQDLRLSANDPQIQMSEDAAILLMDGRPPQAVLPNGVADIGYSLAPYVIVYDDSGKPLASSGLLDDEIPELPSGVLDYTRQHGQDRLTWQPKYGVRSAIVVTRYNGANPGFVAAGRSLREIEKRESSAEMLAALGWLLALLLSFIAVISRKALEQRLLHRESSIVPRRSLGT